MNSRDNIQNNVFFKNSTDILQPENENGNEFTIETDLSGLAFSYKIFSIIFIVISPLSLIFIFLGAIYMGIIFLASYLIVLSFFMYRYFFFRNRILRCKFDIDQQKVLFQRISHKIKNLKELDFQSIKVIKCYKKRDFLDIPGFNQHIVALITSKGKKHRIYFGKLENCERILGVIRNYFKL